VSRSRVLSALGLLALLAVALVVMAALRPITPQSAAGWPEVTPIPLPGIEGAMYSPLPEPAEPPLNAVSVVLDPLQSPLATPMP
jgi:hypothetical protein